MLISIIMTAKNADRFIDDCLQSIINQDESHWELCVVDNFSTDLTRSRLDHYASKDARIKVFEGSDGEIITALRIAYGNSTGEFITRMDADDLMPSNRLSTFKRMLNNAGKGHVATGAVKYISDEGLGNGFLRYEAWLNDLMLNQNHYDDIYKECIVPSPCWMIHRSDLEKCDAYRPDIYPEDYDLCFRFYREGIRVISTTDTMLYWRDYHNRNSRVDDKYKNNAFLSLKWNWFERLSRDRNRPLVLWGAGAKAKSLAKMIEGPFVWASNNLNKIGCNIYGNILVNSSEIDELEAPQIIVAISAPDDLKNIESTAKKKGWKKNRDVFLFF